jgi:DNA polymerase
MQRLQRRHAPIFPEPNAMDDDRTQLLRQVRQRLESLRRAGLDRLPIAPEPVRRPAEPVEQLEQEAVAERAEPAVVAATAARPARDATRPPLVGPKPVSLFGDEGFDEPPAPESERAALLAARAVRSWWPTARGQSLARVARRPV